VFIELYAAAAAAAESATVICVNVWRHAVSVFLQYQSRPALLLLNVAHYFYLDMLLSALAILITCRQWHSRAVFL